MMGQPGRRTASRTWLCLPVAVLGIAASVILGVVTRTQENAGIRSELETQSARIAKNIERRLDEGIRPLSILALFLETQTVPISERFALMARKVESLGIPVGRLAWEPRVLSENQAAFEVQARAAGLAGYRIVKLTEDGAFVPVTSEAEYFPIRLEAMHADFPDASGYDVVSEPTRRAIADLARDRGEPVAVRPRILQFELSRTPAYLIYWPLYRDGIKPGTTQERRQLLAGYVTVAVTLEDLLKYALGDAFPANESILFQAKNPGPDAVREPVGHYDPVSGLTIHLSGMPIPSTAGQAFEHSFVLLHHEWILTVSYPKDESDWRRHSVPMSVSGLGLLATMIVTGIVYFIARDADRDRAGRRDTEAVMIELELANLALTRANALLSERERASVSLVHARTRFLASASHDLRQPLHALALFTSALARRVSEPAAIELVGDIRELGLSMQGMFTSLLDLSRLDTGAVEPRVQHCDMEALTGRLLAEYTPRAMVKGLRARKAGRFPAVESDPGLLESVLRNLIDNAIKFTDQGGILIAGRIRGGALVVEVWDTGPGIPAGDTEEIFEEFERLEATAQKPGFGLGLPIVRKLCALIGASVSVCSRPGHGSRFAVVLRRSGSAALTGPGALPGVPRPVLRKTVLLVDDDTAVLRALSLELTDLGHTVFAASNAHDGMRLIQGPTSFDLAILDLRLDGQHDGWLLADAWQARRPGSRAILMTGSTDAETLRRVHDSGLPALFKPVAPDTLRRFIEDAADRQ
jgi:signal transduction histidine kinase